MAITVSVKKWGNSLKHKLTELLSKITENNLHDEIETGVSVGKEF